jgi:WD40 repeat protein
MNGAHPIEPGRPGLQEFLVRRLFGSFGVPKLVAAAARGNRKAVQELCLLLLSENQRLAEAAGEGLSTLPPDQREALCDQLFLQENQPLLKLCKEQGCLPGDQNRTALFRAVTGDFSHGSGGLDEDHRSLISKGYLAASWAERMRVIRTLTASGKLNLLSEVLAETGKPGAIPARTISLMARRAAAHGDYDWLASRLFSFPVPAAFTATHLLKEACFFPHDGDTAYWKALYASVPDRFEHAYPPEALPPPLAGGGVRYCTVSVNPAGSILATGSYDGNLELWKIPGGGILHTLRTGTGPILSLAFSRDGAFLACGGHNGKLLIIDPLTGAILRDLCVGNGGVRAFSWLHEEAVLAAGGSDGSLVLLSARTEGPVLAGRHASSGITMLAAGENGRIFSGHDDGTLREWDHDGELEVRFSSSHKGPIHALACGKGDAFLVSGSPRGLFLIHSLDSGRLIGSAGGETSLHSAMAIAPDGSWCASGNGSGWVQIWSLPDGKETSRHYVHRSGIRAITPSADGEKLVAGTSAGFIHAIGVQESGSQVIMKGATGGVQQLSTAGNGIIVTLGWQDIIEVRHLLNGELLQRMEGRGGAVSCIGSVSPPGLLGVATKGGLIQLWDQENLAHAGSIEAYLPSITALALFQDRNAAVVAGSDASLLLLRTTDGNLIRPLHGHRGSIHALAPHPDGTLCAAGGWDSRIYLQPIGEKAPPLVLSGHRSPVTGLAFSSSGDILASCSQDRTVCLWDLSDNREPAVLEGHAGIVSTVAVAPDSRIVASGSFDRTVRLWSLPDGTCCTVLKGHKDRVTSVAFCGRDVLASGDRGGRIAFWTLPDGELVKMQESSAGSVSGLVVAPGGRHVLSVHQPGLCLFWHLPWTSVPREASPDDLEIVRDYLRISRESGYRQESAWKFIEMLCIGQLRSSIASCPEPPFASGYEIEYAGELQ